MANAGIDNPVTKDSAGDKYHEDLARQLQDFLLDPAKGEPLTKAHGVMTLTDVYCLYNAARGIEMVSPLDLKKACGTFGRIGSPLRVRPLKSGGQPPTPLSATTRVSRFTELRMVAVAVVESNSASDAEVDKRLTGTVDGAQSGNVSADELANLSGMSLYIAKEQLEGAEARGVLARDESIRGVRYWKNRFLE